MRRAMLFAGSVVLVLSSGMTAAAAGQKIDTERSMFTIHVGKAGLFSAAGHEHEVRARVARGSMDAGSSPHIDFTVDARTLTVMPDPDLSPDKQAEVQQTMHTKVLESEKYPEISFRSTSIKPTGERKWAIVGELTLHSQSRPIRVEARESNGSYTGTSRIKQTDFGIEPVAVGGGLVKVKNELRIEFLVIPVGSSPVPRAR
jgi:polyisoprenoid-binding protein YceI